MILKMIFGGVLNSTMINIKGSGVLKTEVMLYDIQSSGDTGGLVAVIWGNKGSMVMNLTKGMVVVVDITFTSKERNGFYSVNAKLNMINMYDEEMIISPLESIGLTESFDENGKPFYMNSKGRVVNLREVRSIIERIGMAERAAGMDDRPIEFEELYDFGEETDDIPF